MSNDEMYSSTNLSAATPRVSGADAIMDNASDTRTGKLATRRRVQVLNDIVIDQIAAGEVVERPASVVKELVENALDAGAQSISVILENGGQSLIEVQDDGYGMTEDDARNAVKRFGTSKIQTADELLSISTLGFRGEALPSIASVSRFQMVTRSSADENPGKNLGENRGENPGQNWGEGAGANTVENTRKDAGEDENGTRIRIEGGALTDVTRLPAARGTRIEVSQLFYNVPVRRKFLKTSATEASVVRALLNDIASANPTVRFRLVSDGREILNLAPEASFFERAIRLSLAGADPLRIEEELSTPDGVYRLQAILSKPRDAVAGAHRLRLLINGRSVRDRIFLRALRDAFGEFLKGNRYPTGVASLSVPPQAVDVNVHPQKSEVRFRSPDAIFRICHYALRRAFATSGLASQPVAGGSVQSGSDHDSTNSPPQTQFRYEMTRSFGIEGKATQPVEVEWQGTHVPSLRAPSKFESTEETEENSRDVLTPDFSRSEPASGGRAILSLSQSLPEYFPSKRTDETSELRLDYRFVGQVYQCYLFFEGRESVLLVDMHAAHERVTFARLLQQYREHRPLSQMLLIPESMSILPHEEIAFQQIAPALLALGFDAEMFGEQAVIIRAVPALIARASPRKLLEDVLTAADPEGHKNDLDEMIERVLARLACHGSIRSGQSLGREEAFALLEQLYSVELAPFCPHGRPVMIELKRSMFESFFGRS